MAGSNNNGSLSAIRQWFPGGKDENHGWRLDIVSLLAVIGDSSVVTHSQELTASWLCLLPRLIPAPQALLRSSRPRRLPALSANIYGVESASNVEEISFFANIIHDIDDLKAFEFRHYEITYNVKPEDQGKNSLDKQTSSKESSAVSTAVKQPNGDEERGPKEDSGMRSRVGILRSLSGSNKQPDQPPPMVPPSKWSPMHLVSAVSCAMSIGAIIWAGILRDGIALLAIAFISIASSMIGLGLWWHPVLAVRPNKDEVPPGDVMIRTRNGAFIYVQCEEQIARELYVGTERCNYYIKDANLFRGFSGTGTLLLMVSVVLLGNCTWIMQAVVGGIYLILNLVYWATSLLGKKRFWNLNRYNVHELPLDEAPFCGLEEEDINGNKASFTRTLWQAIYATRSTDWVAKSHAVPETEAWQKWLTDANKELHNPAWNPIKAKQLHMEEATRHYWEKRKKSVS